MPRSNSRKTKVKATRSICIEKAWGHIPDVELRINCELIPTVYTKFLNSPIILQEKLTPNTRSRRRDSVPQVILLQMTNSFRCCFTNVCCKLIIFPPRLFFLHGLYSFRRRVVHPVKYRQAKVANLKAASRKLIRFTTLTNQMKTGLNRCSFQKMRMTRIK